MKKTVIILLAIAVFSFAAFTGLYAMQSGSREANAAPVVKIAERENAVETTLQLRPQRDRLNALLDDSKGTEDESNSERKDLLDVLLDDSGE